MARGFYTKFISLLLLVVILISTCGCVKEKNSVEPIKLTITRGGGGNTPCTMEIKTDGIFEVKSGLFIDISDYEWEGKDEDLQSKSKRLSKKEKEKINALITDVVENGESIKNEYKSGMDSIDIIAEISGHTYQSSFDPLPGERMNELQKLTYELVEISPLKLDKIYKYYANMVLEEERQRARQGDGSIVLTN